MQILAITLPEFEQQARRIAGPGADVLVAGGILAWPERAAYDLVMIWLHPAPDGTAWLDGEGHVVLDVSQVQALPLDDTVVFLGACWAVESDPMIGALFEAGAQAVVAGPGENYGGADGLAGADVLALTLRQALGLGVPLGAAWALARAVTQLAGLRGALGAEDALDYQLIGDSGDGGGLDRVGLVIVAAIILVVSMMAGLTSDLITFDSPISPISTSTPVVTWTPEYTPAGWRQQGARYTATPCLDCYPTPSGGITYDIYLPLVMNDYQETEWSLLLEVDGVTVDRSVTATIAMTSTITATNQIVHYATEAATHTLTIEIDQLTMTGYDAGFGSVVTDTGILTWTMPSLAPNTLAELETYYTPITTTAYLTATFGGVDKTATFSD